MKQLDFIEAFLQAKVKGRVFVTLDAKYGDYFPEYREYFGRPLRLLRSMYGMTISGKLFADDLTDWLVNVAGFKQSQCQGSIYYKVLETGERIVVLSYVDDCVYYHTSEDLGRWFVEALGKRYNVNFLGHAHWLMSI